MADNIHNPAIPYRPEVDGLRTIAVLPVIFFHAGFSAFSGGFVGVDVFFVISGYLITSIIISELQQGKFSILRFYERRARRILPALFFVVLCALPFAYIYFWNDELVRFGQSLLAVATFVSNLYFWKTTNYFSPSAEDLPFLHTWSLAVEEQYYLLFPIFLMLAWRFGRKKLFAVTALLFVLSLALAEWGSRNTSVVNFYVLPTRGWELLAGSLIAMIPQPVAQAWRQRPLAAPLSALGLAMVLFAIFAFSAKTPTPSLATLLPILGTALIIAFASPQNMVGRLLSLKGMVGIGLISYSAYLWHQPVFAFARAALIDLKTERMAVLGLCALIFGMAYISWRYVERPFRTSGNRLHARALWLGGIGLVLMAGLGGVLSLQQQHLPLLPSFVHHPKKTVFEQDLLEAFRGRKAPFQCGLDQQQAVCEVGDTRNQARIAFWGDSFVGALAPGLDELGKREGIAFKLVFANGCPPIPNVFRPRFPTCNPEFNERAINTLLSDQKIVRVLSFGNLVGVLKNELIAGVRPDPNGMIQQLQSAQSRFNAAGKALYIVQQGPFFPEHVPEYHLRLYARRGAMQPTRPLMTREQFINDWAPLMTANAGRLRYIDTSDFFCPGTSCPTLVGEQLKFFDSNHLSAAGALAMATFLFLIRNNPKPGSRDEPPDLYAGGISSRSRGHGLQPHPVPARHVLA